jgi:hypothetical protein
MSGAFFYYEIGNPHESASLLEHSVATMDTDIIVAKMGTKAIVGTQQ